MRNGDGRKTLLGRVMEGGKSGSGSRLSTVPDSRRLSRVPQDEFIGFIIKRGSQYHHFASFHNLSLLVRGVARSVFFYDPLLSLASLLALIYVAFPSAF